MNGGHSEALKRRTTVMAQQRGVIAMITTIGVGGLTLAMLGLELHSGLLLIALVPLVVAAQVDLCSRRLPNRLLAAASMPAGLAVVAAHGVTLTAVVSALAGVVAFAGPLLVLHLMNPSGMGFGDVKLGVVLGLLVSTADWRLGIVVLLLASLGSALWCLARSQQSLAFGPPLIASLLLVLGAHRLGLLGQMSEPIGEVLS
jgi:leader peptidase (prepilin peptidase)/N-methyltransferase